MKLLKYIININSFLNDLSKKETCFFPVSGNHKYKETDTINSVQSFLKPHSLWVTLYHLSIYPHIYFYNYLSIYLSILFYLLQGMLDEADGPMNFTQMVTLFAGKMAGGTDDDETILKSFEVKLRVLM